MLRDSNYARTINLDAKLHGAFSLISYSVELSIEMGYSIEEKNKIINDLIGAKSFDNMLKIFTRHFGSVVKIQYRNKII